MAAKLTAAARTAALRKLPKWKLSADGAAIARTFTFADFSEAFGFMARAALVAKHDHPGSRVPHNVAPRASKNSTYELEATNDASRPSRKSTRRSATHVKPDADMRLRAVNRTSSPKRRAARAR